VATNYPGSLDSLTNPSAGDALTSPSHSAQHANANDAIEAIETELGVNPSGTFATVALAVGLLRSGAGSPEGVVTANVGTIYLRSDGGTSTTLYVKTSGTGNTGWTAK